MPTKIGAVRIKEDMTLWKMIKNGSKKDKTYFLQTRNKLLTKKKRQIYQNKQKASIRETNSRKTTISSLDNFYKKKFSILITKTSEPNAQDINIVMINTDAYCATCCLIWAQLFAVSIRNI